MPWTGSTESGKARFRGTPARRELSMPNVLAHVADFFIATSLRWI